MQVPFSPLVYAEDALLTGECFGVIPKRPPVLLQPLSLLHGEVAHGDAAGTPTLNGKAAAAVD